MNKFTSIAISIALAAIAIPAHAQYFKITDLGIIDPPGVGNYGSLTSSAIGINAKGQVSGTVYVHGVDSDGNDTANARAFVWTPTTPNAITGSMAALGLPAGFTYGYGYGINAAGAVAGGCYKPGSLDGTIQQVQAAVLWNGGLTLLGSTAPGSTSNAYGVNASGQAAGAATGASVQATLWSGGGVGLGAPTGDTYSTALRINNYGQVIGLASGTTSHAFLWTPNSPNGTAGTFRTFMGTSWTSTANDINDAGQVAGGTTIYSAFGYVYPYIFTPWTPNSNPGGSDILPGLPSYFGTEAVGLNNVGQAVGEAYDSNGYGGVFPHACYWDANHHVYDLNDWIPQGSGWVLFAATGINDIGQITGYGTYNGLGRGFLLTPPRMQPRASIKLAPSTVIAGDTSTATVTLNAPAPPGGVTINLSTNNLSLITFPASVAVAGGATTATFTVQSLVKNADDFATIIGVIQNGPSATAKIKVKVAKVLLLSLNPSPVKGGSISVATLTLTCHVPAAGLTIGLASDNAAATAPATVTVAGLATSVQFNVNTLAVPADLAANITAAVNGTMITTTLPIQAPVLTDLSLSPTQLKVGGTSTGTVTLDSAAPAGGITVSLTSTDSTVVSVPATVNVAAGATTATFTATAQNVSIDSGATISASFHGVTKSVNMSVAAPNVSTLTLSPAGVRSGQTSTATVTLDTVAPAGGLTVALTSSDTSIATVPSTVTVAAGDSSAAFTVQAGAPTAKSTANITATLDNSSKTATLTVTPPKVTVLNLSPTSVLGGSTSTGTVTIDSAAPSGGFAVSISSSDTSVATVPSSVVVPAGATSTTFTVSTKVQTVQKTVNVTVSGGGGSLVKTLTVKP